MVQYERDTAQKLPVSVEKLHHDRRNKIKLMRNYKKGKRENTANSRLSNRVTPTEEGGESLPRSQPGMALL